MLEWIRRCARARVVPPASRADSRAAASFAARRVGRRRSLRPQRRGLGRQSCRCAVARRLFRLALLQRRRRRDQYERVYRSGDRRPARPHDRRAGDGGSNQTGTVHFNYLLKAGGGLLEVARSFDEHLAKLDASPGEGRPSAPRRSNRSCASSSGRTDFDVAATPLFVEQVESMAALQAAAPPARSPGGSLALAGGACSAHARRRAVRAMDVVAA